MSMLRTPPKDDKRSLKADDPPGTPATELLFNMSGYSTATSSSGGSDHNANESSSPTSATSIPSHSSTYSSHRSVQPRTSRHLFRRTEGIERPVIIWELEAIEDEEDARGSRSSDEGAVVTAIPEGRKRASGADVASDPGCGGAHPHNTADSNLRRGPASDVAQPTSSAFQQTQQRGGFFLLTPDEHRARMIEIMNKREKKKNKKKKKKHSRQGASTSSVFSGTSTDTYESIKEGGDNPYAGYLKAATYNVDKKFTAKEKKNSTEPNDEASSTSIEKKNPSKVSRGTWDDVEYEKKPARPADDRASNINPRLPEVIVQESARKKKHPERDGIGSIASGASSSSRTSSRAAKYAVDKKFISSHTSKSATVSAAASYPNEKDVPRSADEHKARLQEIMRKRELKNKTFKSGDDTSSVSGISSSISGVSSSISGVSSKSASKVSLRSWSDVETEKKYSRASDDKSSNVSGKSSHVSGASSTTSSIFASTRAKLKGYLTSYSRKKKHNQNDKRSSQTSPNTQSEAETPLLSPARRISSDSPIASSNAGKPDKLSSIGETEPLESFPEITIFRKMPEAPDSPISYHGEDLGLETPLPLRRSSPWQGENTVKVFNLPWWMDQDGDQINSEQISGHYSGPINELLRPHGRGELLMKGINRTFHGTWKNGKLVTPLTDASNDHSTVHDPEPVTDDEHSKSAEAEVPRRGNNPPKPTSTKYAINKHYTPKTRALVAAPDVTDNKVAKKPRKPKPLVRYRLGDACRTPQDMIICRSRQEATESAGLLKKWDGAFVKRSCGAWTYAILIERASQPLNVLKNRLEYFYWATVWEVDPREEVEDSMLFAIDGDGSTKIIPKHTWAKYIRRVEPNPVPNIPKSAQETPETVSSDQQQPSRDLPKTSSNNPATAVEPSWFIQRKGMLRKRETQETKASSDVATELHSSIESYFEAEFGNATNLGDSGSTLSVGGGGGGGGGPISSLVGFRSSSTQQLMHMVDSERGSIERSSPVVYENLTDSETEAEKGS